MRHIAIITAIASVLSVSALDLSGAETADTTKVLNEVVVTGTNSGVPQKLLPYTVSVIGSRQLEATGQTQVLSAISGMVPSLFVSQRSIFGVRSKQWAVQDISSCAVSAATGQAPSL